MDINNPPESLSTFDAIIWEVCAMSIRLLDRDLPASHVCRTHRRALATVLSADECLPLLDLLRRMEFKTEDECREEWMNAIELIYRNAGGSQ